MNPRLLTTPLVAATLLLSTLGCSKKDAATPSNSGSYKLDGVLRSCTATAYIRTVPTSSYSIDILTVYLTTTPQPTSGEENLKVIFIKRSGQADTAYHYDYMYLYTKGETVFPAATYTSDLYAIKSPITSTSNNGVSAIFAGSWLTNGSPTGTGYPVNSLPAYRKISDGVFTDVRL